MKRTKNPIGHPSLLTLLNEHRPGRPGPSRGTRNCRHVELDRMGRMRKRVTSSILSARVRVEHVVGEHPALGQEVAILVEVVDRHVERGAHVLHLLPLVAGGRSYRSCRSDRPVNLVMARRPAPPLASPRMRYESRWIRESHFDPSRLGIRDQRDTARSGAVA